MPSSHRGLDKAMLSMTALIVIVADSAAAYRFASILTILAAAIVTVLMLTTADSDRS